jgi:hypothetical protein
MRSLLKYGISSSRHFIHTGRDSSHWDDETIDGLQVVLDLNTSDYAYAKMWFTDNDSEAFAIKLFCHSLHISINILVSQENQSLKDLTPLSFNPAVLMPSVDRISRRLRSGKQVSAALKKADDSKGRKYWVDTTVDPEGHLRWPEPGQA